ncbi:MAG: phosphonate metabolism protein/1,5-bisphosphokinase (PRPP-forming) PhnN [Solirubrobacterales bacterium]|nr:phosphonate metabolism protein/1,5-bisphosphokinase (PRPP-forming) PhnN [Solirubrobacterales bacterium]
MSEPIGPGAFIAVVGASGSGKDALLSYASARAAGRACFPRRTITRPLGQGEDHDPVEPAAFLEARNRGEFAVWWQAHGLHYGIPTTVDGEIRAGRPVVANVSRAVLALLGERYARLLVIRVTVTEAIREARLRARAREGPTGIAQRLTRADPAPGHPADAEIANVGTIAEAGDQLLSIILSAA